MVAGLISVPIAPPPASSGPPPRSSSSSSSLLLIPYYYCPIATYIDGWSQVECRLFPRSPTLLSVSALLAREGKLISDLPCKPLASCSLLRASCSLLRASCFLQIFHPGCVNAPPMHHPPTSTMSDVKPRLGPQSLVCAQEGVMERPDGRWRCEYDRILRNVACHITLTKPLLLLSASVRL